jgi:uncharacterized protein YigE (DUF2233 family)
MLFSRTVCCKNTLFFDGGEVHGVYAPELGRSDAPGRGRYKPIIGVID